MRRFGNAIETAFRSGNRERRCRADFRFAPAFRRSRSVAPHGEACTKDVLLTVMAHPKVRREQTMVLMIAAEKCPHVLTRIFSALCSENVAPFNISTRRGYHIQKFAFEIDGLLQERARSVIQALLRIKMVRSARFETLASSRADTRFAPAMPGISNRSI